MFDNHFVLQVALLHFFAMEIKVNFSVSMVIAVVLAEAMSFLWYNNNSPWGQRIGDRYLITALVSDIGLVVLLKFLME